MRAKYLFSFDCKTLHGILLLGIIFSSLGAGNLPSAHAQGDIPVLFTETDAISTFDITPAATRTRYVGIDLSVLSGPQGDVSAQSLEGSTIQMNLFPDLIYNVVIDSVEVSASGGTAWNGHIDSVNPSYVYMVYTEGVFAAHIGSLEGVFEVHYAGEELYSISQLDQSLYPDDVVLEPELPTNALPPIEPGLSAQAITYIDVMVLYTARAVTEVGGVSAMNAKVDLAIQEANQSYINSNVDQRLNLVYKGQVSYDEGSNPDFGVTLDRLTEKSDGYIDNVHALRDTYNADLVSLMIQGNQYCGIAWLMASPSVSFEAHGFSVVAQSCATGYYSFAHELGHNMGSRHDTFVDQNNTPYPYSHGFAYPSANWRTIMAYNSACSAAGTNCMRLQYWSNPEVSYGGVAMGNTNTADNHRSLNNTAATVAAFRTTPGFNKSSPINGATNQLVNNLDLSWGASAGATQYEVCYDTTNDNVCNSSWQNKGNATSTTITGLSNSTTYYWQVRAYNGSTYTYSNNGAWWSFTTINVSGPPDFSKLEPANDDNIQSLTPTLLWEQSTGATSYAYCYDTSNNGNCDSSWNSTGTATAALLGSLSSNTTYYWQVRATNSGGTTEANGGAWWSFTTLNPSSNDDFLGATQISALPYDNPGTQDTRNATSDSTDPDFPCGGGGKKTNTVWFKYAPATTATFYVDTVGSDYDTVLGVWTGTEGALTNVACNDDYNGLQSQVTINGTASVTYYIEVASYNPDTTGWLNVRVTPTLPAPNNDDFAAATMATLPYLGWVNVEGATTDVTDPVLPCGPLNTGYRSVWFKYTPAFSGEVVLSTYWSGYDTVMAVWTGTEGALTNVACNDDTRGTSSKLRLNLNSGTSYYIEVAKYGTSLPALDYWLFINLVKVGDDFDEPLLLSSSIPLTTTLDTSSYSYFPDDPDFADCGVFGNASVWYRFEPSQSGTIYFNTVGSNYDTVLGIWSGDRTSLTPLACNDDSGGNLTSSTSVSVSAGNTYFIEVAEWWGYLDTNPLQDSKSPPANFKLDGKYFDEVSTQAGGTLILNVYSTPGGFNKISPSNGAIDQTINPTLQWEFSPGGTSYEYCYDTTNDNACSNWVNNGTSTSKSLSGLTPGTTYYWHVRSKNSNGATYSNNGATNFWSFSTVSSLESTLYMTENQGTLRGVNQSTGATTILGNLGTNLIQDLSSRAGDNTYLYSVESDDFYNSRLAKINVSTGVITPLPWFNEITLGITEPFATAVAISPTAPDIAVVAGFSIDNGVNYYLWKVNVNTGIVLDSAVPTTAWLNALTYNLDGSILYGTDTSGQLVTVNSSTGAITLVGYPGITNFIEGLAFRPSDGVLFAIDAYDQDRLVKLNPTDGSLVEVVGNLGVVGPYGLAFLQGSMPGNFNKSMPSNGATDQSTSPTLSWESSSGATGYYYCYDTSNDNACSNWTSNGTSTSKSLSGLSQNTTYYWHVRAVNSRGTTYSNGSSTAFWSFNTGNPGPYDMTSFSTGVYDGHIFELSENNNVGWRSNANSARFYIGDDSHNRQYLSILSFDTSSLPDNAVILSATLNVKRARILGTNPFDTHGALGVEIGSPCFGSSCSLEASDFQAGAQEVAGLLSSFSVDGWHSAPLGVNVFPYIDLTGITQFRLRFELEDNNDRGMDAVQFLSGNASPDDRPQLVIEYYVP